MSSRVFKAKSGHTKESPQICGLSNAFISKGDWILYLVCHGTNARPEYQIKILKEVKKTVVFRGRSKTVTEKDYGMDNGRRFRSVFGGWGQNPDTGKREKVFTWQEFAGLDADGEEVWNPVKCWSHIVLAEVADSLGYEVRKRGNGKWATTTAYKGDRAIGNEHTISDEGENAMEVLARAACTDEELGLVPPSGEVVVAHSYRLVDSKAEAEAEAARMQAEYECDGEAEEDRLDAEALGMTLEQYRRALARNS